MPNGMTGNAQIDYLERVEKWIQYLIASGAVTPSIAGQMLGSVAYEMELGGSVADLPYFSDVSTYFSGLAKKEKGRATMEARGKALWEAHVAQGEQGRYFTRGGQTYLEPPGTYRHPSEIQGMSPEERLASGTAGIFGAAEKRREQLRHREPSREERYARYAYGHPLKGMGELYYPFLETQPEHIQKYFGSRMGGIISKSGISPRQREESRKRWFQYTHGGHEGRGGGDYGYLGGIPGAQAAAMAATAPGAGFGSIEEQAATVARLASGAGEWQDPWESFLKRYPFLEEFTSQPARERGYYPRKFRPPTRFLSF